MSPFPSFFFTGCFGLVWAFPTWFRVVSSHLSFDFLFWCLGGPLPQGTVFFFVWPLACQCEAFLPGKSLALSVYFSSFYFFDWPTWRPIRSGAGAPSEAMSRPSRRGLSVWLRRRTTQARWTRSFGTCYRTTQHRRKRCAKTCASSRKPPAEQRQRRRPSPSRPPLRRLVRLHRSACLHPVPCRRRRRSCSNSRPHSAHWSDQ